MRDDIDGVRVPLWEGGKDREKGCLRRRRSCVRARVFPEKGGNRGEKDGVPVSGEEWEREGRISIGLD